MEQRQSAAMVAQERHLAFLAGLLLMLAVAVVEMLILAALLEQAALGEVVLPVLLGGITPELQGQSIQAAVVVVILVLMLLETIVAQAALAS